MPVLRQVEARHYGGSAGMRALFHGDRKPNSLKRLHFQLKFCRLFFVRYLLIAQFVQRICCCQAIHPSDGRGNGSELLPTAFVG